MQSSLILNRKSNACRILLAPLFGLLILTGTAHARWGALEPDPAVRPTLSWLSRFAGTADVIATNNIDRAINQCDQKVGRNNYCVVELQATKTVGPFSVDRSKTKIVATVSSQPVSAIAGRATITISSNTEKVVIENLRLTGVRSGSQPVHGIWVSGRNIKDIVLRKNRIYNYDSDSSAHGIVVLGSGTTSAQRIEGITIDRNHLHDMRTGASESIAINGNVSNWVISNNRIEHINNIAIDAIGGEGTAAPVTVDGRVLPNPVDAARDGWIENNVVNSMSTLRNPAYGQKRSWAGAIYVDGGRSISVTGNTVRGAPWAYDIGAENCVVTQDITMRNNTATNSYFGDLRLGGYAENGYLASNQTINCDPHSSKDSNEGHGYVRRLTIAGNRFRSVKTTLPRILVEYRTTESIIAEPGRFPVRQ